MRACLGLPFALALVAVACGAPTAAPPLPAVPAPYSAPVAETKAAAALVAASSAMADKLIIYGDMTFFAGRGNPENCILKSRYKRGEPVGFRMSAIEPLTGKFAETAELVVSVNYGGKTETIPMRYRGTGDNPRPGFWTGKWVVPDDAPTGIVKYTVTGKDKEGRTGEFKPFDIEASLLTITD